MEKDKEQESNDESVTDVVAGFETMPILARLEFVSNLLCNKSFDTEDVGIKRALKISEGILEGVIEVLRTVPDAAQLGHPEP